MPYASPKLSLDFWLTGYKLGFSGCPPGVWSFAKAALRTQENTSLRLPACFIGKDVRKDTDEQADEVIQRKRSGRFLITGRSVCAYWGVPPSQHVDVLTNQDALCIVQFRDFYGGFITWAWLVIMSIFRTSPLPSGRMRVGLRIPRVQSCLGLSSDQLPSRNYPGVTSLEQKTLTPITQKISKYLGSLCQEPGSKNTYIFFHISQAPILHFQRWYLPALQIHRSHCLLVIFTSYLTDKFTQPKNSTLGFFLQTHLSLQSSASVENGTPISPFAQDKNQRFMIPHWILLFCKSCRCCLGFSPFAFMQPHPNHHPSLFTL